MADVAAHAGVSRALVSIVFRDMPGASQDARRRVRAAAEELGYQPDLRARLLSRHQSQLIGVTFGVGHEFHADLISELYVAAQGRGYELTLSGVTRHRGEAAAIHDLMAFRCDAVVLLGPTGGIDELSELARSTPTVVIARALSAPDIEIVRTDDEFGARLATRHLIELGHTKIAHVDGGRAPGAIERRRGYRRAMRTAGLDDEIVILKGGLNDIDGSAAAHRLVEKHPDTTGVVVFNDQAAFGFLATARSLGYGVPDQLSVTGYDNTKISRADWVRLTTVGQQASTMARLALDRAIARIGGEDPGAPGLIEPTLIVRGSTAAPRVSSPGERSARSAPGSSPSWR